MSSRPGSTRLHDDAMAIWMAGTDAVKPHRLIADKVGLRGKVLDLNGRLVNLIGLRRLVVVGAGKASAAMAIELDRQVFAQISREMPGIEIEGWINCPAGSITCQPRTNVHLHAARPDGVNVPTEAAVVGTRRILELVRKCDSRDLVLCLISGGGSALLVAPPDGISLSDKQQVAQLIAAAGGNIQQLNCVRRSLSLVKGGGLLRACRAGRLISLVLSDVIGDPLETIASGPTFAGADCSSRPAIQVLDNLQLSQHPGLQNVIAYLRADAPGSLPPSHRVTTDVEHILLGNNADAVDAAGVKAVELGYRYVLQSALQPEPDVTQVAKHVAAAARQIAAQHEIDCWISGGEPTVRLPDHDCGLGGRNQHLTLATMHLLMQQGWPAEDWLAGGPSAAPPRELVFLSAGTDGEDGPTDAAGAWFDRATWQRCLALGLDPSSYLRRADAYHFFEQAGGLIHTGPTGTNVCDLRLVLCHR